ncbi:MAG TPA: AAA family ATPase [Phycisphaerae bacterium]|nr:AAA family ATPase [Phycisphaerae bacterium]HRY71454.1 AAA family ATPase [Phycisphaerae bacterium]HSA30011.1 AAA family ATPase [Phycisphaerae bacterium]
MAQSLRPQTLDEMIGQEAAKQKARIAIGAAIQRGEPLPHVLQTSSGGLGKTCFARILANEMFSPLVETSGPCVASVADLRRVRVQLEPGSLLHIDEAHAIGRPAAEELLLVLEEHILNLKLAGGKPVVWGFGSSGCRCRSHLAWFRRRPGMEGMGRATFPRLHELGSPL